MSATMSLKGTLCLLLCLATVACGRSPRTTPTVPDATTTAVPTATAVATAVPGVLAVAPTVAMGSISPYFLGTNYGPWIAVPVDMLPAAYTAGVESIRFPAGSWGDQNDLKPYQIDAFMAFAAEMGAIPTISVRLQEGTAEAAADLVRYTNIEKGYGVVYWSIGNEPTLFAAELRVAGKADDYDTAQFNREWREFALAMKAVDPDIQLLGPETHQFNDDDQFNPKDSSGRDWMIEFLKANGDLVDVVTFHRYPFPKSSDNPNPTIDELREHTREWDRTINYLEDLIQTHTGREIPIAVTEVNTHWNKAIGGEATPDSHYNAVWLAETLGQLMRPNVVMVNHWMLTSSAGYGGWGLIGRGELRPSYYVYRLFSQLGDTLVYADSGVANVSLYATRRDDGALTLLIINLADTAQEAVLQIDGVTPRQADLWQLDPEHRPEAPARFTFPADGRLALPGQSVSLYIIQP